MANFRKNTYATWQQASEVVKENGISSQKEYILVYHKLDPLLPSNPNIFYPDFPGWEEFLADKFYKTWAESLVAAVRLGVTDWRDYHKKRHFDRRLRSKPQDHYADFVRGSEQFRVQPNPKPEFKPELFHEFKHEKEFEECY